MGGAGTAHILAQSFGAAESLIEPLMNRCAVCLKFWRVSSDSRASTLGLKSFSPREHLDQLLPAAASVERADRVSTVGFGAELLHRQCFEVGPTGWQPVLGRL
jgi:hypothetical protein